MFCIHTEPSLKSKIKASSVRDASTSVPMIEPQLHHWRFNIVIKQTFSPFYEIFFLKLSLSHKVLLLQKIVLDNFHKVAEGR